MTIQVRHCAECSAPLAGRAKQFCSTSCRMTFNNRRMQRGAELYDLFRAMRRERDEAKRLNIWTKMCQLELGWQQEDEAARPGRRSYMPPRAAIAHLTDKGSLPRGEVLASACLGSRRI